MIYAVNRDTKEHRDYSKMGGMGGRWELVHADADGWIEWKFGECPLPKDARVEYRMRGESEGEAISLAGNLRWCYTYSTTDIIAYRPIIDQLASEEPKEWRGVGLPPVGTVCECLPCIEWVKCKIVAHRDGYAVAWVDEDTKPVAPVLKACHFRPIRTDRERWVEKVDDLVESKAGTLYHRAHPKDVASFIHDALASGELEMPARN